MGKKRKPKFVSPIKKGQYLLTNPSYFSKEVCLLKCIKPLGRDHAGEGINVQYPTDKWGHSIWKRLVKEGKVLTEEEAKLWLLQESMK